MAPVFFFHFYCVKREFFDIIVCIHQHVLESRPINWENKSHSTLEAISTRTHPLNYNHSFLLLVFCEILSKWVHVSAWLMWNKWMKMKKYFELCIQAKIEQKRLIMELYRKWWISELSLAQLIRASHWLIL